MARRYIVLRDRNLKERLAAAGVRARSGPARRAATVGLEHLAAGVDVPPDVTLEQREVEDSDAGDFRSAATADEETVAVAEPIPVAPIEPLSLAEEGDSPLEEASSWGLAAVGADSERFTGKSAVVAVIDSGVRESHQAFAGVALETRDFTGSGDTGDRMGHGTHCAATIVGRPVGGRAIGVAPGVRRLLVGKIFHPGVESGTDMVISALDWAVESGADVISLSLSFNFTKLAADLQLQQGLQPEAATARALFEFQNNLRLFDSYGDLLRAKERFPGKAGVLIVAAAGNHSMRRPRAGEAAYAVPAAPPSSSLGALAVGAVERRDGRLGIASFSNTEPDLVAPGVGIVSAGIDSDEELVAKNGTSMACPHVAGLAARWWDAVRQGPDRVKASTVLMRLQATATTEPLDPALGPADRGHGLVTAP